MSLHLAPFPKPLSSIVDDFPTEQNHKGWQVRAASSSPPLTVHCRSLIIAERQPRTADASPRSQIGYVLANDPNVRLLKYWPPASGERKDGRWSCTPEATSYPSMQHSLMHPCARAGTTCCGHATAPIVARFNSFFASEHAVLIMAYEVWPICGDGLDMEIALTSTGPSTDLVTSSPHLRESRPLLFASTKQPCQISEVRRGINLHAYVFS